MHNEFTHEFSNLLEIDIDKLDDQALIQETKGWDSIVLIGALSLIDRYYGVLLDSESLREVQTFGQLKDVIARVTHGN